LFIQLRLVEFGTKFEYPFVDMCLCVCVLMDECVLVCVSHIKYIGI